MRALLAAVLVVSLAGSPAMAATPDDLQALYAQAAAAGQRFDQARVDAEAADQALVRERRAVRQARAHWAEQAEAIEALTVQQWENQTGLTAYAALLRSEDPRDLLERASAYTTTAEAMTARVERLSADRTVHEAAERRLAEAQAARQDALALAESARAQINAALARSKAETKEAAERRAKAGTPSTSARTASPTPTRESAPARTPDPAPTTSAPRPEPEPETGPEPDTEDVPDTVWDKIAQCESGGNWHINTGNGYYGGLQFSAATWKSVGGPGLPHEHSREVQIHYAEILLARSGWGQWSCAGARFD